MRLSPLFSLHDSSPLPTHLPSAVPLAITALLSPASDAVTLPLPSWLRWVLGGGVSLTSVGIAWWWIKPRVIALVRSTVAADLARNSAAIAEFRAAIDEARETAREAYDVANRTHDAMRMLLERQETDRRELSSTLDTVLEMVRQIARRMDNLAASAATAAPVPSHAPMEIPPR